MFWVSVRIIGGECFGGSPCSQLLFVVFLLVMLLFVVVQLVFVLYLTVLGRISTVCE